MNDSPGLCLEVLVQLTTSAELKQEVDHLRVAICVVQLDQERL